MSMLATVALLGLATLQARAASFVTARYEAATDEIVVTLAYRGTHPNHSFSTEWGECHATAANGSYEITARVLDNQWNDRARDSFRTTARFSLSHLRCRPATVTLFTEPDFRISVFVPARGNVARELRGPRTDVR